MPPSAAPFPETDEPEDAREGEPLVVAGALTINEVEGWSRILCDRLAAASSLAVDLRAVESIDTIGVQLLCIAGRTALARGGRLVARGPSPVVERACLETGLLPDDLGLGPETIGQ